MPKQLKESEVKQDIIKRVNSFIGEGESHCMEKHSRIQENRRYERGEQWKKGDMERQALRERPAIPHNSIIKIINAIANREIVARFEARTYGRDKSDNGIANCLDEFSRWQRDGAETEHEESQAVRSMVGSGYGVMHMYWNPVASDGDGKVVDEELPVEEMLWPARARRMNLIDRRWNIRGKVVPIAEAEAEFGIETNEADEFFNQLRTKKKLGIPDTGNTADPVRSRGLGMLGWGQIHRGAWVNTAEDEMMIAEAEWKEYEVVYKAAVPDLFAQVEELMLGISPGIDLGQTDEQGQPMQLTYEQVSQMGPEDKYNLFTQLFTKTHIETFDEEEMRDFLKRYMAVVMDDFPRDYYRRVKRETVKWALVTNNIVWDYGTRPYATFTYEFLTGWRVEGDDGIDFYGVIDVAKGPQDFKNAVLGNMLTQYMTSPKGHMFIEDDLIPNQAQFNDQFAKPIGVTYVPPGFVGNRDKKWTTAPPPSFPQMNATLLQIAYQGIEELFGLSSVDLGTQGDLRRVSGTTVQAAKTASNTIVASLFDSIRRFRKRYGFLALRFLTYHYSPDQMIRTIGEDKADDMTVTNGDWGDTLRFDVKVEESPTSPTERMELLERLQQVGSLDNWLEKGYITFPEMLDLVPHIPESFKRDVKLRIDQDAQTQAAMDEKDQQIAQLQLTMQAMGQYVSSQPEGEQIMQEFEATQQFAQTMAQQIAAQMTQQSGPEGEEQMPLPGMEEQMQEAPMDPSGEPPIS